MKQLLLTAAIAISSLSVAQTTLFQENWDGAGPGISGWTLYNVDGLTPISLYEAGGDGLPELITNAWNVLSLAQIGDSGDDHYGYTYPPAATGMSGNVAVSNSWYDPAGTANDWLVSPQITIPASAIGTKLTWSATSLGATAYLEDYKVYISTTGNQVSNFTTVLKNVVNQPNTGSFHTVDISSYAGQNVYIAFRNDSNDQYVMLLDNIKVETQNTLATVENSGKTKVAVYPNPATDVLNVDGIKKTDKVQVYDASGKLINVKINDGKVNISNLNKGNYILKIDGEIETSQHKFIKK